MDVSQFDVAFDGEGSDQQAIQGELQVDPAIPIAMRFFGFFGGFTGLVIDHAVCARGQVAIDAIDSAFQTNGAILAVTEVLAVQLAFGQNDTPAFAGRACLPIGEGAEAAFDHFQLYADGGGTRSPEQSEGLSMQLVHQHGANGIGFGGVFDGGFTEFVEDEVNQVPEGGGGQFTDLMVDRPQPQFTAKEIAIRTLQVLAEGGDGQHFRGWRHMHRSGNVETTECAVHSCGGGCGFGGIGGRRRFRLMFRFVKPAYSVRQRGGRAGQPESSRGEGIAIGIGAAHDEPDLATAAQDCVQDTGIPCVPSAIVSEIQLRAEAVGHEGIRSTGFRDIAFIEPSNNQHGGVIEWQIQPAHQFNGVGSPGC